VLFTVKKSISIVLVSLGLTIVQMRPWISVIIYAGRFDYSGTKRGTGAIEIIRKEGLSIPVRALNTVVLFIRHLTRR
jgi:hypothetical protein